MSNWIENKQYHDKCQYYGRYGFGIHSNTIESRKWPGMVAYACNPSTQEAEIGGL
jgi:hypothetical protein